MTEKQRKLAQTKCSEPAGALCRNCGYCEPCQQKIDINNVLRFYQYYKNYDLKDYARSKYKTLKIKATKCTACGKCLPRCPYKIDIPKMLIAAHKKLA